MKHEFQILIDGRLETYDDFDKIPAEFDNVISFKPFIPEGPHTHEEHSEIELWNDRLKELMRRERK